MEIHPKPPPETNPILPKPEKHDDVVDEHQDETTPEKVLNPNRVVIEGLRQNPDVALAHALESADEPVEGQREKRAEIRDDNHAASIGSILAGMTPPQKNDSEHEPVSDPPPTAPPILAPGNKPGSLGAGQHKTPLGHMALMYRQAIFVGFAAALILLILWLLLQIIAT